MKPKRPERRRKRRLGKGLGSGRGKTCGRGEKGQLSRTGSARTPWFEGGQNPFYRRVPKRGFNNNAFKKRLAIVNIADFSRIQDAEITPEKLLEQGVLHKLEGGLKVLGDGKLERALTVRAHAFSHSAKRKIERAGGKAVLIGAAAGGGSP